jgi:hypothetical protein
VQTINRPLGGARSPSLATYIGIEDSGPWWAEPTKGESAPIRGGSLATIVIITIMCVLMEVFLCLVLFLGCQSLLLSRWREPVVSKFLGHNWRHTVPRVLDPNSSPQSFHRAGGQSRSFDGRQNSYSYGTMGIAATFGGVAMGLRPPWS